MCCLRRNIVGLLPQVETGVSNSALNPENMRSGDQLSPWCYGKQKSSGSPRCELRWMQTNHTSMKVVRTVKKTPDACSVIKINPRRIEGGSDEDFQSEFSYLVQPTT